MAVSSQAEAICAKLMQNYNEERLHAALGYMTLATWHRSQPNEVRAERALPTPYWGTRSSRRPLKIVSPGWSM